jgi:hypothetical protein
MYYDIINIKWRVLWCFILFGYPLFGQPHGMYCGVLLGLPTTARVLCLDSL